MSIRTRIAVTFCFLVGAAAGLLPVPVAAQQAQKPIALRWQDFGPIINSLPALLARTEGLYDKAGLSVTLNPPIFNASQIVSVVLQGQAEIGYTGSTSMIPVVQQRRPAKIIAVIASGFETRIALTPKALDALAKKGITPNSPFKDRVAALRGLTIAAPASGSTTDLGFRYSLKKNGIEPARDLTIQPLPTSAAIMAVLRQGTVDGMVGSYASGVGQANVEGFGRTFIEFDKEDARLANAPYHILVASDDYVKANPEAVRRVLQAFQAAKNMIRRGLTADELGRVKKQFYPDMDPATYKNLVDNTLAMLTGPMAATREQLEVLLDLNNAVAETPVKLTMEQLFDTRIAESVEKK